MLKARITLSESHGKCVSVPMALADIEAAKRKKKSDGSRAK